jgi:hypothetical protein
MTLFEDCAPDRGALPHLSHQRSIGHSPLRTSNAAREIARGDTMLESK